MGKNERLKIPDNIKLKLWVLSGGRCEFPGCNKIVWRDGLTLKEDNFAHMAHLVASSPKGPRGDVVLSKKLAKDFSNLLLVCLDHSKLVDGKHRNEYPLDLLKFYKKNHEDRIKIQTAIGPDMATTVVRFMANIGDRKVDISLSQAYQAIFPRFPFDEKGVLLDYTNKEGRGNKNYWKNFAQEISNQVKRDFVTGYDRKRFEHLSIFALGPIPLLMHLGNQIGNIISCDIYQKHRDTDDWSWRHELKSDHFTYILNKHNQTKSAKKIIVVLSLSGKIHRKEVAQCILEQYPLYEITTQRPGLNFLAYKSRLEKFKIIYRKVITEIRKQYGSECEIHMFPAVPAPIAVVCGSILLPKSDPKIFVYDKEKNGFVSVLKIN